MLSPTQPANKSIVLKYSANIQKIFKYSSAYQESELAAAMTRGSCGSVESALTALYYTCKNCSQYFSATFLLELT